MTTNAMTCDAFNDMLMAYLEHETDDATRAAVERHSVSCADCGALLADLRKLRIDAANLPELSPSRDLWSGIAARIEAPVVSIGTSRASSAARGLVTRRWLRGALLAASLVGAAGIGYFAASSRPVPGPVPPAQVASAAPAETLPAAIVEPATTQPDGGVATARPSSAAAEAPSARPSRQSPQYVLAALSADYDREIARLRTLIEQRRNQLDPVTVAIIEKNLQVIDTAITECKKAIARDPSSRFLIESLNQSLQTKLELMRTAALLPSRI